jgi:hypothetical protein
MSLLFGDCLTTKTWTCPALTPWHEPHIKRRFQKFFSYCVMQLSYGPHREHRFPLNSLVCVWNLLPIMAVVYRVIFLPMGLHATIHYNNGKLWHVFMLYNFLTLTIH